MSYDEHNAAEFHRSHKHCTRCDACLEDDGPLCQGCRDQVEAARQEIEDEDRAAEAARNTPARKRIEAENARRSSLPSEHPDHVHGMMCDGQDGLGSYCCRLRMKLFGYANSTPPRADGGDGKGRGETK